MMTMERAEGLLNALRDVHVCAGECAMGCVLDGLNPVLPADRELIAELASLPV